MKLIIKSNVTRQIIKYIAEVVIIFVGITFSFLFDQWREEREQKKELIELAQSLLTDVGALKSKLKNDLGGSTQWISQLDSLRLQRTSGKFKDKQLKWFYKMVTGQILFLFDPYSPTYMAAATKGSLHELPENIKNQLYKLYRVQLPFFQLLYNQQQENIINFRNSSMVPESSYFYTSEASQLIPDLTAIAKELQKPAYGNFINQVIITEKEVYRLNEDAYNTLVTLENSLIEYVNNSKN